MGYGLEAFALLQTMHGANLFRDVHRVMDIGSQELHFSARDTTSYNHRKIIGQTLKAMGGPELSPEQIDALGNRCSAGEFFRLLGWEYASLDADGRYSAPFDFNLDSVRDEDRGAYCLVLNAGTTEHVFDQRNVFQTIHDLTRPGGVMIHAVPFMGQTDHGFYNYNPVLFNDLAYFNGYETLGIWINMFGSGALVPWNPEIEKFLKVPDGSGIGFWCALRKTQDLPFCIPFQGVYESAQDDKNLMRYDYVIDGRVMTGLDVHKRAIRQSAMITFTSMNLVQELLRRLRKKIGLGK